jgi:hypothetical protein
VFFAFSRGQLRFSGSTWIPQLGCPQIAQITADSGWLLLFEQLLLIHPEGEKSFFSNRLKICVISEICGFYCGF